LSKNGFGEEGGLVAPYARRRTRRPGSFGTCRTATSVNARTSGFSAERTRRRNASSPPSSSVNQPEYQEQQDRSNRRRYDRGNETTAKLDMKVWQKPVPYQGAHDSNCNVSDQAESSTLNQLASKPTRDQPHEQNDE